MTDSAQYFYDRLAAEYHLIFADWRRSVMWQGKVLDEVISEATGKTKLSILDCTCGIGTQAIGLALQGHRVRGTDISLQAIRRARREAKRFGITARFGVADIRNLESQVNGTFDSVISCDNALPHLMSESDLDTAVRGIYLKLRPGGLFLASIRDYDAILEVKPGSTLPQVYDDAAGRRITFQVWDWQNDRTYLFNLFILKRIKGAWETSCYSSKYRCLYRQELSEILSRAGFVNIRWLMTEESDYYQPIVTARK